MRTQEEIQKQIAAFENENKNILVGNAANIQINAPLALQQLTVESSLKALYWAAGMQFVSKLNRQPL